jgi:hypothetical protein
MSMVGGLDLHRRQITYDVVDVETGACWRGRLHVLRAVESELVYAIPA